MKTLYKSLPENKCPRGFQYKLNKWYKEENFEGCCGRGFHGSQNIIDAMGYVTPGYLAIAEVRGESDIQDDKEAWSEICIIKWKKWEKKDSLALAIYAAELVLENFEKEYPEDKRPREAIEAAKAILELDTEKNRNAAESAASAAWSAAWSAGSAARSAGSAAESAASAAEIAAESAASAAEIAAESAAYDDIQKKCHDFVISRIDL